MLLFSGHLAASGGARSWGSGNGASDISGGPYHIKLIDVDGAAIGNRDNQIMAGAILPITTSVTTSLHETDSLGADLVPPNNGAKITVDTGSFAVDYATVTPADAQGTVAFRCTRA